MEFSSIKDIVKFAHLFQASYNNNYGYGGSGGDAGGIINQASVAYLNKLITVVVGAENGGKSSVNGTQTPDGVKGGSGAIAHTQGSNKNATHATTGTSTTGFLYPPTSVGGSGGGGGAYSDNDYEAIYANHASGGSPGGGAGSNHSSSNGSNGEMYGSGGGGGYGFIAAEDEGSGVITSATPGGAGKQGVVGFMWRYKS